MQVSQTFNKLFTLWFNINIVSDIVERFTLSLTLLIVAFRNLIELSGAAVSYGEGFALPKSFGWFRGDNVLWTISYVSLSFHVSA